MEEKKIGMTRTDICVVSRGCLRGNRLGDETSLYHY